MGMNKEEKIFEMGWKKEEKNTNYRWVSVFCC